MAKAWTDRDEPLFDMGPDRKRRKPTLLKTARLARRLAEREPCETPSLRTGKTCLERRHWLRCRRCRVLALATLLAKAVGAQ